MARRNLFVVLSVIALTLAFNVAAAAAAKGGGSTGPTGPTNLRITGGTDTSVSLAWDAASKRSNTCPLFAGKLREVLAG